MRTGNVHFVSRSLDGASLAAPAAGQRIEAVNEKQQAGDRVIDHVEFYGGRGVEY